MVPALCRGGFLSRFPADLFQDFVRVQILFPADFTERPSASATEVDAVPGKDLGGEGIFRSEPANIYFGMESHESAPFIFARGHLLSDRPRSFDATLMKG
jgi:hypothetical protein